MAKKTHIDENQCGKCGVTLRVGDYPFCPHDSVLPRRAQFDAIVVFRDAKGELSFPGRSDQPTPKGYRREEITTIAGYHALRREMDTKGNAQSKAALRAEARYFETIESQNRSDLQTMMLSMDPASRAFAQHAIDESNRRTFETERDPGFHMPVFENDSQAFSE